MPYKWVEVSSFTHAPEFIVYLKNDENDAVFIDVSGQNETRIANLKEKGVVVGEDTYKPADGPAFLGALTEMYGKTSRLAASFIKSGEELPTTTS